MASPLTAGELDTRITVLIPVTHESAFNEPIGVYETFVELWAKRHDVSTAEALRAQEVGSKLTARFTVRYSATAARIDARFRIQHNGQEFNIIGVKRVERNHWIEIDAVARGETAEAFEVSSP